MTATQIATLVGGVGLFLLGMNMMTDGLKLAAGSLLRDLLARWTSSRWRGLLAGALVTALVQSSSAVTVAVIGFVNAGILTLPRAVWLIFGSNVGTTMTGWLVAVIGVTLKVEGFALPAIGIGMIVQLVGHPSNRIAAAGRVLAGFGLFFLGIGLLKDSFTGAAQAIDLSVYGDLSIFSSLVFIAVGIGMTTAMQSSSAAVAIALTAAAGGLIEIGPAAALVIGANVGTTSTGILAVLNATPTAKRVAVAHCLFNVLTGIVAVILLPLLIIFIEWLQQALKLHPDPATSLALFHTTFNIIGVLLVWPLSRPLIRWLETRFTTLAEIESRPVYLDESVLSVPDLGLSALRRELDRLAEVSARLALSALAETRPSLPRLEEEKNTIDRLGGEIGAFANKLARQQISASSAVAMSHLYRALQHHVELADNALAVARIKSDPANFTSPLRQAMESFSQALQQAIRNVQKLSGTAAPELPEAIYKATSEAYEAVKAAVLLAASKAEIDPAAVNQGVDLIFHMRRCLERMAKARRREMLMLQMLEGDLPAEEPAPIAFAP